MQEMGEKKSPQKIMHYELKKKLGEGGMGEVWLAIDTNLARPVALKILPRYLAYDEEARVRFHREAKAASALNHPNIVTIFETGTFEGQIFIAMEYIEGQTVRELIDAQKIDKDRAIDITKQALLGLSAAHEANIIHRDIKPENLMVRRDGYVKILDFGLAKMLDTKSYTYSLTQGIVGTPKYMSPEQATGKPLTPATDVFSLSAVFYEMLSGKAAFEGENIHIILSAITGPSLPPAIEGISPQLMAIIYKGMAKDIEERYKNAREMLTDLIAFTSGSFHIDERSREHSIVVIPFHADEKNKELVEGITDEIIDNLLRLKGIRVMSKAVSLRYRDKGLDPISIGQELNVEYILMGNLRTHKNKAKIMAQLVKTRDGFQCWGDKFTFSIEDIFEAEDHISKEISKGIRKYFFPEEPVEEEKSPKPPAQSTAKEYYLQGMYLLNSQREEDIKESIGYFKKAVEEDPQFAVAYARLSEAYLALCFMGGKGADPTLYQLAQKYALKSINLDPQNPDALVSLALVEMLTSDIKKTKEDLEKVLSIAPNHPEALSWLSYIYTLMGDPDQGVILARRAIQRDPRNANHYIWLAYGLASQGRYLEASDALDRALRLDPGNPYPYVMLLFISLVEGQKGDAKMLYEYMENFGDTQVITKVMKNMYRILILNEKKILLTEEDIENAKLDPDSTRFLADIYALLEEKDKMYDMLYHSKKLGCLNLSLLDTDPFLQAYRKEEKFKKFREELKFEMERVWKK